MSSKPSCDDQLLPYFPHVQNCMFFVTLAINMFGIHIIVNRSPPTMSSFKSYLLIHQIFAAHLDASFLLLGCPCFIFPIFGVHIYGLYATFGIPPLVQLMLFLIAASGYMASVLLMLFARQQVILPEHHIFRIPAKFEKVASILLFICGFCITLPIVWLLEPDQKAEKEKYQENWPCQSISLMDSDTYVLSWGSEMTFISLVNGLIVLALLTGSMLTLPTAHMLLWRHKVMSKTRRRAQTAFFLCMLAQVLLPMLVSVFPVCLFAFMNKLYYNRMLFNNLVIHFVSLHGAISTITMIITYGAYRKAFLNMLPRTSLSSSVFVVAQGIHRSPSRTSRVV